MEKPRKSRPNSLSKIAAVTLAASTSFPQTAPANKTFHGAPETQYPLNKPVKHEKLAPGIAVSSENRLEMRQALKSFQMRETERALNQELQSALTDYRSLYESYKTFYQSVNSVSTNSAQWKIFLAPLRAPLHDAYAVERKIRLDQASEKLVRLTEKMTTLKSYMLPESAVPIINTGPNPVVLALLRESKLLWDDYRALTDEDPELQQKSFATLIEFENDQKSKRRTNI